MREWPKEMRAGHLEDGSQRMAQLVGTTGRYALYRAEDGRVGLVTGTPTDNSISWMQSEDAADLSALLANGDSE